jgi:hypothetical protein
VSDQRSAVEASQRLVATTREKLEASKREIAHAEELLRDTLQQIKSAPRAEKVTMSESVRAALDNLRNVRTALNDIEQLIRDEDTD